MSNKNSFRFRLLKFWKCIGLINIRRFPDFFCMNFILHSIVYCFDISYSINQGWPNKITEQLNRTSNWIQTIFGQKQASAGLRRPRRPRRPNRRPEFPALYLRILPGTKTRRSMTTLGREWELQRSRTARTSTSWRALGRNDCWNRNYCIIDEVF